jgi:ubiquilin
MNPDNPMIQALLNNPEAMRNMMNNNPVVQRLAETNPEIAQVLSNPETMQHAMRMMSNPVRYVVSLMAGQHHLSPTTLT